MSLFEDSSFQWRETYFVFFNPEHHPSVQEVERFFGTDQGRLLVRDALEDPPGKLEAMTLLAPADGAGVDITYVDEEEVAEQKEELQQELRKEHWSEEEKRKCTQLLQARCRFDVFHFQHQESLEEEEGADLDPGAILSILTGLAKLCRGVAFDPQSCTFI